MELFKSKVAKKNYNTTDTTMKLSSLPRSRCLSLLNISSNTNQVKQIHTQMIINSLISSDLNLAKLIAAYFATDAGSCSGSGHAKLLFQRYNNKLTCTHVLRAFALSAALSQGEQVHCRALKSGLSSDVAVATTAIRFYSNCGDTHSSRKVFDEMCHKNSVTWNAMLAGYCADGAIHETLFLFRGMRETGVRLTERTAVSLLSACVEIGNLRFGSSVHGLMYKLVPFDIFIGTGLVHMYSKCGSLQKARNVFGEMGERNVLTWTAMVAALAMHGRGTEALELMDGMVREGVYPNEVTFTCLLSACCHAGLLEEGVRVFETMKGRFGVEPGVRHYGCLVDLLGRAGLVEEAREVVRGMPVEPDSVVWRALLSACKVHGRVELGKEVGRGLMGLEEQRMDRDRSCEDFVALSNVYASAERWEDVWRVREAMRDVGLHNKAGLSAVC